MDICFDNSDKSVLMSDVHNIPCSVNFNGLAPAQKYFKPYVSSNNNGEYTASLRGNLLTGEEVELPEGYTAVVLKQSAANSTKVLKDQGRIKSFILWKTDVRPHSEKILKQAFQYIEVADEMHRS